MSEEPSKDAPGIVASQGEPVPAPVGSPRRSRRTALILGCAAVLSAAAIAVAVVWSVGYAPPGPKYSRVPEPCALISLATLAKYVPDPTGTPARTPALSGAKAVSCGWTGTTGGEDRTVGAVVVVFGSSSGVSAISAAQQSYDSTVSADRCHCKGVTVSTQPVTGLGDQATALFITVGPDANVLTTPNAETPGATLVVQSSNALIALRYTVTVTATGATLASRTDAAQLTGLVSMARDVLAALARPAATSPAPGSIAPISPEPHYAGHRDPCRLITTATLAKYAPGATVGPLPNPAGSPSASSQGACAWGLSSATSVLLTLNLYPDASSAQQGFNTDTQSFSQSEAGATVTGAQWLPGLGEQAAAIFQTQNGAHLVEMLVWSGNAELEYSYYGPGGRSPDRVTLLAGGIAIARDALAALANPAASAYPQEPVYASPHDTCTLIRPATVATYLPGSTASPTTSTTPLSQLNSCGWTGLNGSLSLFVTIYPDPDSALGGFETNVQNSRQNQAGFTFDGAQPVKDLGQQATAIFETSVGSPEVDVYVLSGNAEIDVDFVDMPFNGPQPSRASVLAADIVMAREVLADLRRT